MTPTMQTFGPFEAGTSHLNTSPPLPSQSSWPPEDMERRVSTFGIYPKGFGGSEFPSPTLESQGDILHACGRAQARTRKPTGSSRGTPSGSPGRSTHRNAASSPYTRKLLHNAHWIMANETPIRTVPEVQYEYITDTPPFFVS